MVQLQFIERTATIRGRTVRAFIVSLPMHTLALATKQFMTPDRTMAIIKALGLLCGSLLMVYTVWEQLRILVETTNEHKVWEEEHGGAEERADSLLEKEERSSMRANGDGGGRPAPPPALHRAPTVMIEALLQERRAAHGGAAAAPAGRSRGKAGGQFPGLFQV